MDAPTILTFHYSKSSSQQSKHAVTSTRVLHKIYFKCQSKSNNHPTFLILSLANFTPLIYCLVTLYFVFDIFSKVTLHHSTNQCFDTNELSVWFHNKISDMFIWTEVGNTFRIDSFILFVNATSFSL